MNTKYMFIVAAMAVMLIGATALATEDAFAGKKKYGKNQAISQANDCGNGFLPENVWMPKHCISNSGRRERSSHRSRSSIPIRKLRRTQHCNGFKKPNLFLILLSPDNPHIFIYFVMIILIQCI